MTFIEGIAVVFGFLCVWLTVRQNIWCWPAGLVQVILYIYIFYQVKLYSDLILHLVFVWIQIYGWYHWLHGGRNQTELKITELGALSRIAWPLLAVVGTGGWGYFMATYTDADVPYGDAFTTVLSLIAQWLMAHKRLESWLFWIVVDVAAIGIYWHKSLYLTSGLYAVFLVLAILGWLVWRKTFISINGIKT